MAHSTPVDSPGAVSGETSTAPPLSAQRFTSPRWMGYRQCGHPWTPFSNYALQRGFAARYVNHQVPSADGTSGERRTFDRESVAFHLSWHTFGLLEAVFRRNVEESLLLEAAPVDGQPEMTLDRLQPTLKEWGVAVSDLSSGERDVRGYLNYAAATQRAAYSQFMGLVAQKCFDNPGSEHLEICRLINYTACLGEALWITTAGLFYAFVGPDTIPPNLMWANAPILHDDSLFNTVVADGWCPSTINYLLSSANLATLRLALLQGALYEEQHPECTGEKCALVNVGTDHYVTQHTSEGCGCSFLGPDVSRIAELLRQEKIPVIRPGAREDSSETVSISVLDGSCTEYVAFSHVWADGLGSTSEVGLPACQPRRLAGMASELVESGAFWIDGLCVPGHADLRKLSIRTMADTYRKAKAVLVLDNGIMAASSTTDRTDILLRAFVSRWMRRLWTFQEAVLAKDIYIKVSDTALPLMRLVPEFKEQLVDPVLTGLGLAFASLVSRGRARIFNITDVARELRWRDTSKTADETLAIASLLNVSAFMLSNAAPIDRMRLFLLAMERVPRSLPFLQVEKLQTPGFRWAPSTFLCPFTQSMPRHDTSATCTAEGLRSHYYTLVFDEVNIAQGEVVRLDDVNRAWSYVVGPELPQMGTYRCNAILLLQALSPGDTAQAVAVLFDRDAGTSRETPFIPYLYQRRVLIGKIHSPQGAAMDLRGVTVRTHGELQVRIS